MTHTMRTHRTVRTAVGALAAAALLTLTACSSGDDDAPAVTEDYARHCFAESFGVTYEDSRWFSTYRVHHRIAAHFRTGPVFLAGDAAHVHSPVGAQGMNTGLQDAHNLGWKLAAVLAGEAPEALLDSYDAERVPAAEENILNSTRSTDFITPKSDAARAYRDAVLALAVHDSDPMIGPHRELHPFE